MEQRKIYCKGQARLMGGSFLKDPNTLVNFREGFLKARSKRESQGV